MVAFALTLVVAYLFTKLITLLKSSLYQSKILERLILLAVIVFRFELMNAFVLCSNMLFKLAAVKAYWQSVDKTLLHSLQRSVFLVL